jgi:P-type E1-E2 ATPase
MASLQKLSSPTAAVIRQEEIAWIPSREVVPGDIILIEQGNVIGADVRLFEVTNLQIDEAMLTGESEPITKSYYFRASFTYNSKSVQPIQGEDAPVGDRINMAYMSCHVTKGKGKGSNLNYVPY